MLIFFHNLSYQNASNNIKSVQFHIVKTANHVTYRQHIHITNNYLGYWLPFNMPRQNVYGFGHFNPGYITRIIDINT